MIVGVKMIQSEKINIGQESTPNAQPQPCRNPFWNGFSDINVQTVEFRIIQQKQKAQILQPH